MYAIDTYIYTSGKIKHGMGGNGANESPTLISFFCGPVYLLIHICWLVWHISNIVFGGDGGWGGVLFFENDKKIIIAG